MVNAKVESSDEETVKENIGKIKTGSKTDDEVIQRLIYILLSAILLICMGDISAVFDYVFSYGVCKVDRGTICFQGGRSN